MLTQYHLVMFQSERRESKNANNHDGENDGRTIETTCNNTIEFEHNLATEILLRAVQVCITG